MRAYSYQMTQDYHAVALFSGGLDSILAARTVMEQGLRVKCLHFVTPFFGKPHLVDHWRDIHGLDIEAVDVSDGYAAMLAAWPRHGFGKFMNPCVDCKIFMLRRARQAMDRYGASFIVSGEVVGQRPMSQRHDVLNTIRNEAGVKELLLRPLSAKLLDPTPMELPGQGGVPPGVLPSVPLVDRERLHGMGGRGRKEQLALAERFGLAEIPTPAGGCMLADKESAKRYWPLLARGADLGWKPDGGDFRLANLGRMYFSRQGTGPHWLAVGRDKADNEALAAEVRPEDLVFDLTDYPSPLAVGRPLSDASALDGGGGTGGWDQETVKDAAAFTASFSPKAVRTGGPVDVTVRRGENEWRVKVVPERSTGLKWKSFSWKAAKAERLAREKAAMECGLAPSFGTPPA